MAVKLQNMKNSEITEQIKLFNWARSVREFIPELKLLHHIPNEGKRTNGALLKAAGMVSGVPDLSLPVARPGIQRSVHRNEIREQQADERSGRIYGHAKRSGLQNGGCIFGRRSAKPDPALSGTGRQLRSG